MKNVRSSGHVNKSDGDPDDGAGLQTPSPCRATAETEAFGEERPPASHTQEEIASMIEQLEHNARCTEQLLTVLRRQLSDTPRSKEPAKMKEVWAPSPPRDADVLESNGDASFAEKSLPPEAIGSRSSITEEAVRFNEDVEHWVREAGEQFHVRVFLKELLGQNLHTFFGPLCLPVLLLIYGSRAGLRNRWFLLGGEPAHRCFGCVLTVLWLLTITPVVVYAIYRPPDIMWAEMKLFIAVNLLKNATIAIKYAYMSSAAWRQLNEKSVSFTYSQSLLINKGWLWLEKPLVDLQSEISFVEILGTRSQREVLKMKFIPWPRSEQELLDFRESVDVTNKTLLNVPTGEVVGRKVVKKSLSDVIAAQDSSGTAAEWFGKSFSHIGLTRSGLQELGSWVTSGMQRRLDELHVDRSATKDDIDQCQQKMTQANAMVFAAAVSGTPVHVEALFRFVVDGTNNSENSFALKGLIHYKAIFVFLVISLPVVLRWLAGKHPLGETWISSMVIVPALPVTMFGLNACVTFTITAATDMWRRRSFMRSCSALLTLDRTMRSQCPAEVQSLPILDVSDAKTVECWWKLRRLCLHFGRMYYLRIQAFTTVFMGAVGLFALDLVVACKIPAYMEMMDTSLTDIVSVGVVAVILLACIVTLAALGDEVNEACHHHVHLLRRHRSILACKGMDKQVACSETCRRTADLIEAIVRDLEAQHRVQPIMLCGMYCGWTLLTSLYVLPASIIATVAEFCMASATAERCYMLTSTAGS
eukprot:TRINITY_DN74983_c0_g1_i1.p1 TRINITY_DN74983_c0_g1~~TRINITY_DN74983_c0_g1_i1.p1  ORF type:complete len:757 (-),score=169.48 TRINITY_DN74983_c0_g1_i1:672-2942(-)